MQTKASCRSLILGVVWAAAAALTGCGGSTARIAGTVTHNGEPVRGADVVVESVTDAAEQYFGITTDDGSLYVGYRDKSGLPPGRWKIRVTHFTQRDGQPLPSGEAGQALRASNRAFARTYLFDQELAGGRNVLELKLEAASGTVEGSGVQQ
jgi:hypothetical protein